MHTLAHTSDTCLRSTGQAPLAQPNPLRQASAESLFVREHLPLCLPFVGITFLHLMIDNRALLIMTS